VDKLPADDLIALMKENYNQEPIYTSVAAKAGRSEEIITGFEFSFDHNSPKKAFQVANILATSFVEHYKMFREGFASTTSSFFEDERLRLREEIAKIDLKISEFKEKNVNYLPELFQLNYRMLEGFENKLFNLDQEIRLLRGQRRNLELSLVTINPLVSMEGISGQKIVTPEEKLTALKSELDLLLATYSEKHPDVIRSRNEIKALEKVVSQKANNRESSNNEEEEEDSWAKKFLKEEFEGAYNPAYINLITQIEQLNLEIETLERGKKEFEKDLFEYQMRVGKTPLVEKEYRILNRDLDSAQTRYNQLVSQVLTLESAAAMEKREMGGKLTIGQPPTFPLRPIKPNRPLIVAGAFILGTGLGVLMLLGWESLTQTVRTPQDISKLTEIPVLSEMPTVITEKKARKRFSLKYAAPVFLLIIIFIVLFVIDTFYLEVDVVFVKTLEAIKKKFLLSGL
jgi:hypothetical protein